MRRLHSPALVTLLLAAPHRRRAAPAQAPVPPPLSRTPRSPIQGAEVAASVCCCRCLWRLAHKQLLEARVLARALAQVEQLGAAHLQPGAAARASSGQRGSVRWQLRAALGAHVHARRPLASGARQRPRCLLAACCCCCAPALCCCCVCRTLARRSTSRPPRMGLCRWKFISTPTPWNTRRTVMVVLLPLPLCAITTPSRRCKAGREQSSRQGAAAPTQRRRRRQRRPAAGWTQPLLAWHKHTALAARHAWPASARACRAVPLTCVRVLPLPSATSSPRRTVSPMLTCSRRRGDGEAASKRCGRRGWQCWQCARARLLPAGRAAAACRGGPLLLRRRHCVCCTRLVRWAAAAAFNWLRQALAVERDCGWLLPLPAAPRTAGRSLRSWSALNASTSGASLAACATTARCCGREPTGAANGRPASLLLPVRRCEASMVVC